VSFALLYDHEVLLLRNKLSEPHFRLILQDSLQGV